MAQTITLTDSQLSFLTNLLDSKSWSTILSGVGRKLFEKIVQQKKYEQGYEQEALQTLRERYIKIANEDEKFKVSTLAERDGWSKVSTAEG